MKAKAGLAVFLSSVLFLGILELGLLQCGYALKLDILGVMID